jgi:hypothetical protein
VVYNQAVRFFLSILQLLLLSLPTFASTFSAVTHAQDKLEATLPACCRRAGMHHCMLSLQHADSSAAAQPGFSATPQPCPFCPKALPAAQHAPATPALSALIFAQIVGHPACVAQTLARRRISQDRSRQKRGPPTLA